MVHERPATSGVVPLEEPEELLTPAQRVVFGLLRSAAGRYVPIYQLAPDYDPGYVRRTVHSIRRRLEHTRWAIDRAPGGGAYRLREEHL